MKITKKKKAILLYILGLLLIVMVYSCYFVNKRKENNKLRAEIHKLQTEVKDLEDYEVQIDTYQEDAKKDRKEVEDIVARFPAKVTEEDAILYARSLETSFGVQMNHINMEPSICCYSFGTGDRKMDLYSSTIITDFQAPYESMKQILATIQNNEGQRKLVDLSLEKDTTTGWINGKITWNLYSLAAKNRVYNKPDMGEIPHGTSNIFGQ